MCCDDAYLVTPYVSALAGCDRLVSEPLVIENYSISEDSEEEPIEEEPLEEPKEKGYLEESEKETDSDLLSDARSRPGPAESGDVRTIIIDVAHAMRYSVHPGADKMYYDLREMYWWSGMKKGITTYVAEFSYNNSYYSSIRYAPFEALYERKCRSTVLWAEIRESQLVRPELVQETTDKVVLIKERLKAARYHQKSYEVGAFEILERIGLVDYRLKLPQELSNIYDTFHVLNLKRCLADANLHVPVEEIKVDKTLCFVEEPVEIINREVKSLKHSRISIVKVHWNLKQGHEDFMKTK
ncbi:putative reverse transcriptase domain-containing protein [Tanacetum coccineum]